MPQAARERAQYQINDALRGLTGNLLRVVRGSGMPQQITMQVVAAAAEIARFAKDHGEAPDPNSIAEALLTELHDAQALAGMDDTRAAQAQAEQDAVDGALAIVAGRLLDDPQRVTNGRAKLRKGVRALARGR
jgi:hypothetical protein